MKTKVYIIFISLLLIIDSNAQSPQAINYQGVARDSQGHPLPNQSIGIRLSVLDSSITGQVVYAEIHNTTTNNSGLFNLRIGLGSVVSGTFANIPWGQGDKWLKIEMDATGGNNYQVIGTTQFLSVPYALHAQTAESISSLPKTIQERLDAGETPKHIYETGVSLTALYGKNYLGGLLFYLDLITEHGLIAAPHDQSTHCQWYNGMNIGVGAFEYGIGGGAYNTSLIVSVQGPGNYAAYLCDTLSINGYDDWYLPSRLELNFLHLNLAMFNSDSFSPIIYWSSSEHSPSSPIAFSEDFSVSASSIMVSSKSDYCGVRAIRSF